VVPVSPVTRVGRIAPDESYGVCVDPLQHQGCFCGNVELQFDLPEGVRIRAVCENCPTEVLEDFANTHPDFDQIVDEMIVVWNGGRASRWRKLWGFLTGR
jgi:hypothetical protein